MPLQRMTWFSCRNGYAQIGTHIRKQTPNSSTTFTEHHSCLVLSYIHCRNPQVNSCRNGIKDYAAMDMFGY